MTQKYPYAEHDDGIVLAQPKAGAFVRTSMTPAQLAARDPALAIALDIYRHANHAGVCYIELWEIIAKAIQEATDAATKDLTRELNEIREALAGTDYASLPSDFSTVRVAHAIRTQMEKFLDQARNACTRAEAAERALAANEEKLGQEKAFVHALKGMHAGDIETFKAKLRKSEDEVRNLVRSINEANGPTFMGEASMHYTLQRDALMDANASKGALLKELHDIALNGELDPGDRLQRIAVRCNPFIAQEKLQRTHHG